MARDLLENAVSYLYDDSAGLSPEEGAAAVRLNRVIPNPFKSGTSVSFAVSEKRRVRLSVYDVQGRLVSTLFEGSVDGGEHLIPWDGRDARGGRLAPGVYFLRLSAGESSLVRKMVLQK